MRRFLVPFLMVFAIAALLMGTAPANANMALILDDLSTGGVDIIIVDDFDGPVGTGTPYGASNTADGGAGDGIIAYNGGFGTWIVNVTTGISKPIIGDQPGGYAKMDLASVNVSGTAPGTLVLALTDTDFVISGQEAGLTLQNAWGGTANGEIVAQGYLDPANGEFVQNFANATPVQFGGPGAFSGTVSANISGLVAGAPFSLYELVNITHTAAGQITSFDKELTAVPEPGTMLLIGTGLLGLAGLGRRRLRKK